jgi:hypothetical protein
MVADGRAIARLARHPSGSSFAVSRDDSVRVEHECAISPRLPVALPTAQQPAVHLESDDSWWKLTGDGQ